MWTFYGTRPFINFLRVPGFLFGRPKVTGTMSYMISLDEISRPGRRLSTFDAPVEKGSLLMNEGKRSCADGRKPKRYVSITKNESYEGAVMRKAPMAWWYGDRAPRPLDLASSITLCTWLARTRYLRCQMVREQSLGYSRSSHRFSYYSQRFVEVQSLKIG